MKRRTKRRSKRKRRRKIYYSPLFQTNSNLAKTFAMSCCGTDFRTFHADRWNWLHRGWLPCP
jgi:hypothetical protein